MSSTGTDLIAIETLKPAEVFTPGGVEKIICKVEADVRAIKVDASTDEGRGAIKSLAYKISRSKTALDDMGKDFVAELKRAAGVVDADRRTIRDRFDALRDEVRKPVDDWEADEKARIDAHVAELERLKNLAHFDTPEPSLDEIDARLPDLVRLHEREWEEFAERAADLVEKVSPTLTTLRATVAQRNEERAELERFRRAEAERAEVERLQREREEEERRAREQREREERIAQEAREEAERKQREAEEAARREVIAREALEEARRLDAERVAAAAERARQDAAAEAEHQRVFHHEQALAVIRSFTTIDPAYSSAILTLKQDELAEVYNKRDWQEFKEQAAEAFTDARSSLSTKIAHARQREDDERKAAEERIAAAAAEAERQRAAAAAEAERKRAEEAAENERAETARREADQKHRARINQCALADLMEIGLTEEQGKLVIRAIASGKVCNVKITY